MQIDPTIAAIIRHALTFVGAWLARKGYIESSDFELFTGGIIAFGATVWSLWQKYRTKKTIETQAGAIETALTMPPATPSQLIAKMESEGKPTEELKI
jgi:hypothetical protein